MAHNQQIPGTTEHRSADSIEKCAWAAYQEFTERQSTDPQDYPAIVEGLADLLYMATEEWRDAQHVDWAEHGRTYRQQYSKVMRRRVTRANAEAIVKGAITAAAQGLSGPFDCRHREDKRQYEAIMQRRSGQGVRFPNER